MPSVNFINFLFYEAASLGLVQGRVKHFYGSPWERTGVDRYAPGSPPSKVLTGNRSSAKYNRRMPE
ncbi:MAG: hypothetical protein DME18_04150 [Verrucomicrobia bacterium]|nr:MAG: hypothetical protein DME18_04150 [Verrucomicrobiota bacterium]